MPNQQESMSSAVHKTLLTTVVITMIGFLSSVATARILGPQERGLLSAALLIGTLSGSIAQLGLGNAYVYFYGSGRRFNYFKLMVQSLMLVACLAVLLGIGGLYLSNKPRLTDSWIWILLFCAGSGVQVYYLSLSQLKSGLIFYNKIRFNLVFGNAFLLIPVFYVYRQNATFEPVLWSQLLVALTLAGMGMIWSKQHHIWDTSAKHNPTTIKEIARYGLHQHGSTILSLILLNFDKVILISRGSMEEYGYYAMAFTTSRLLGALQESLAVALFARFAGKDIKELSIKVRTAFRLTFAPMLLVAAIGAALSPWLIVWVYGNKFAPMALPFAILLFECAISGANGTLAQRFTAAGRPGLLLVRQFISFIPVCIAMQFLPVENIYINLALLMLLSSVLRLLITLAMFPLSLKESIPQMLPDRQDINMILKLRFRSQN